MQALDAINDQISDKHSVFSRDHSLITDKQLCDHRLSHKSSVSYVCAIRLPNVKKESKVKWSPSVLEWITPLRPQWRDSDELSWYHMLMAMMMNHLRLAIFHQIEISPEKIFFSEILNRIEILWNL